MRVIGRLAITFSALLLAALPLAAQSPPEEEPSNGSASGTEDEASSLLTGRPITMQHFRAVDQRGINVFESPKDAGVEYSGFKLDFNAAFTTQLQSLDHRNTAVPVMVDGVNTNQLADIGFGFNNSTANLSLHAQLADGIRVQLTTYLSPRHHNDAWVKDGYLLVDKLPIDLGSLNRLMEYVTLRVGHFELNYGDAHFRRSDNGNAMHNPFIGNYIMDAFTTEIGGEVYVRLNGFIAMGGITGGEIRGTVVTPGDRGPAYLGKLGFDRMVKPNLRVRMTGSVYTTNQALNSTLYGGDRAGSRYYYVMENTEATESAQFTSGLINPGLRNRLTAQQYNPFVKFHGLEVFGVVERATGGASAEPEDRTWNQYAADVVYRFLPREQAFGGIRYNKVEGPLAGMTDDARVDRWQVGGGWFVTPNILMKAEYVRQKYYDFPATDIRNGGKFNGLMLEGVVAF
jgi:hypothetical protein